MARGRRGREKRCREEVDAATVCRLAKAAREGVERRKEGGVDGKWR